MAILADTSLGYIFLICLINYIQQDVHICE